MTKFRLAEARLSPNHTRFDAVVALPMMPSSRSCAWIANVWVAGLVPGRRAEDMDVVKPSAAALCPMSRPHTGLHIPDSNSHGISPLLNGLHVLDGRI
jgi:hypothetical protein